MRTSRPLTAELHQDSDDLLTIAEGYEAHARPARRTENPYRRPSQARQRLAWDVGWLNRQNHQIAKGLAQADRRAKDAIVQQLSRWITMCVSDNLEEVAGEGYEQALRDFRDMLTNHGEYRKQKTTVPPRG